jgi:hypothetical protein
VGNEHRSDCRPQGQCSEVPVVTAHGAPLVVIVCEGTER